jgi:hypothetical protein
MPPATAPEVVPPPKTDREAAAPTRAKLIVERPADAGRAYHHVIRAEVARDGKQVERTKRVIARPGEEAKASFTGMGAVATARAGG